MPSYSCPGKRVRAKLAVATYLERLIGGARAVEEELGAVDVDDLVCGPVHDQHWQSEGLLSVCMKRS